MTKNQDFFKTNSQFQGFYRPEFFFMIQDFGPMGTTTTTAAMTQNINTGTLRLRVDATWLRMPPRIPIASTASEAKARF